jgi:hypothetical protein
MSKNIPFLSNSLLDNYRMAQHMAPAHGFHKDMMTNAAVVMQEAKNTGVDPAMAVATMLQESNGNAGAMGDFGFFSKNKKGHNIFHATRRSDPRSTGAHSGGLFQLFDHGEGSGMSMADIVDPHKNAARALGVMKQVQDKHMNLSVGQVAAMAQRPADQASYAASVNNLYPLAQQIIKLLEQQNTISQSTDQHLAETKTAVKQTADHQRKAAIATRPGVGGHSQDMFNRNV